MRRTCRGHDPVRPAPLRFVERAIRQRVQLILPGRIGGRRGDAAADRHLEELTAHRMRLEPRLDVGAEPLRRRGVRSEEHTSELQSLAYLVCRLLLEKKKSRSTESIHND